jgi:peptide/nickel transport system substrate-binding protein
MKMKKTRLTTLAIFTLVIVLVSMVLLVGCSSGSTTTPPTSAATTAASTTKPAATTNPATSAATTTPPKTTAAPTSATPKYGGTLRYADPYFPSANIGWIADSVWGGPTTCIFFEAFLKCDSNGTILPNLATKWTVSSDLKTVTLNLREGVKFHDGSDFNATVAKWNIEQQMAAKRGDFQNISSVEIVDNLTIKINMTKYTNSFLSTLSDRNAFVMSKNAYDTHGANAEAIAWMRLNPVGTGPFKLDSFKPGVVIKGLKFENYWQKGLPYLDGITVTGITDATTRAASFQAGEQDMVAGDLTKTEYDLSQKGFPVNKAYLAIACLVPSSANPSSPLSNPKVRQAVDYCIDRDSIAKALGYGFWPATAEFAMPGTPAYVSASNVPTYNPEKSKQLLSEAGLSSGFKTTIYGNVATTNKDVMVAVQGYMAKVGITAEINMLDNAAYSSLIQKGWDGFAAASKSINANMNISLSTNWSKNTVDNVSLLKTDELDALISASATSAAYDPALVQKAIKNMIDTNMVTFLYGVSRGYIYQPTLQDMGLNSYANLMIWDPGKTWFNK